MRSSLILLALSVLFLSGCGTDAYYGAIQAQLELKTAKENAEAKKEATPPVPVELINHTWTDIDGNVHTLTVNQPPPIIVNQQPAKEQQLVIPHPWEMGFRIFDRTLTAGERFLPFYLLGNGGATTSNSPSYQFGDGTTFLQTPGDNSSIDASSKTGDTQ